MKKIIRRHSGFTLFEIIVALAVLGLILGIVMGNMDDMLDLNMKKATAKMGSTIRYIYNKSATEGIYVKLVLDISENAYWVEATSDPVTIIKEDESSSSRPYAKKDSKKEEEKAGSQKTAEVNPLVPGAENIPPVERKEPVFTQVDSYLLKPSKLPDGIFFKDIYVEHRNFPMDSGQAEIYFFPNGYVQSAIINFRDEDDELIYSLKTSPISGRVSIEDSYRSLEE
ncbi:MAG TPA: prepilin-type N-terminal cleavage/methylation domain-containing protein [bacterium]|nr:prepilin-type N-terminal cleavage/methylation domain-containing protein [Myxococcales bacterium]OQA59973.1 MAG: hypothetical protein BWY40_01080 [bacterium ADurb.Bin270]HPW45585.1 prepilin-type N-terminal cleavage/methylation domain-containing protein [bacterium]HQC50535.1 prepilin-type N-terminal cleavage/methylation domain-containing protein [bacterium]HQG13039.1 prepilin-type N-terminal cleavage/methylation domain-containing protein [bacterium]